MPDVFATNAAATIAFVGCTSGATFHRLNFCVVAVPIFVPVVAFTTMFAASAIIRLVAMVGEVFNTTDPDPVLVVVPVPPFDTPRTPVTCVLRSRIAPERFIGSATGIVDNAW